MESKNPFPIFLCFSFLFFAFPSVMNKNIISIYHNTIANFTLFNKYVSGSSLKGVIIAKNSKKLILLYTIANFTLFKQNQIIIEGNQ